jgi:hypothetical protein
MSDLSKWTGPLALGPFQFREAGPPQTLAEELARMSDAELLERSRVATLAALDGWGNLPERGRELVRRLAPAVGLDVP